VANFALGDIRKVVVVSAQECLCVSDKETGGAREEREENEPSSPPPWVLDGAPREVVVATLRDLAPFINDQLRGRWGHDVPHCWFWHIPLTLSCLAIRQRYEDELVEMTSAQVLSFFGYELFSMLDATLIENEPKCQPVGHPLSFDEKPMSLEEFVGSPYLDYIWLGEALRGDDAPVSDDPQEGGALDG
jgi:hypothetical protein